MNKEIKKYLEDELKNYTEELEKELKELNYLIINYGEKDISVESCFERIKYLGNKKRKLLKLLKMENENNDN